MLRVKEVYVNRPREYAVQIMQGTGRKGLGSHFQTHQAKDSSVDATPSVLI